MKISLNVLAALILVSPAGAETVMYVTDQTRIPIRTGQSTQHKILKMVPSGQALTVLSQTSDGYSRVRTAQGMEGWMLSRQLMSQPNARDRLSALQERYTDLESESAALREKLAVLESDRSGIEQANRELTTQSQNLNEELADLRRTAARPLELEKQNRYLQQQLNEERETVQQFRNENLLLREETKRKWFLTGTVVTLGSLFLGLIIPRIPWRKRRGWSEL